MRSRFTDIGVGLAYLFLAVAALKLTRLEGGVAILWVANAVPLARLCSVAPDQWRRPLCFSLAANVVAISICGVSPFSAPAFGAANLTDILLAVLLLRRCGVERTLFETGRSVITFILIAGVAAPAVSGLLGATTAAAFVHKPWLTCWIDWTIGHGLGQLIAAPMALFVMSGRLMLWRSKLSVGLILKAVSLLGLVAGVAVVVFSQERLPLLFLTSLPVLMATFQIGEVGAAVAVVLVAIIGGAFTVNGRGPITLVSGSHVLQMQFFQFYLATTFLIALPVTGTLKQRERLLAALQESESLYRLLADNITDAILSLTMDGTIRYASPAVRELAGLDPEDMVGRSALTFVYADDVARMQAVHEKALASPDLVLTLDYRVVTASGALAWFETCTKAVRNGAGQVDGVVSTIRGIGERKLLETQLREAAETDPLTGLPNRRAFMLQLKASIDACAAGKAASLAMIDLDYFKRVNDEHGHGVGDVALMLLGDVCRDLVRANDVVARMGGEEFALILNGAEPLEAQMVCDRLRQKIALCEVPVGPGRTISLSASIGVASVQVGTSCDEILAIADAALYRAKAQGRNRVVVAAD